MNYNCHGEYWVDLEESVARAVRQVEHVVARGFAGALWYVGNEDGAQGGGIESVMPRSFHGFRVPKNVCGSFRVLREKVTLKIQGW